MKIKYSKNNPFISGSVEGKCRDQTFDQMTDCDCISLDSQDNNNQQGQGNLLRGIDNKTIRREGISICLHKYVLFSVTNSL